MRNRLLLSLTVASLIGASAARDLKAQCATTFPTGYVPFSFTFYITGPNLSGDRLLVGSMTHANFSAISNIPLPNVANQQFCGPVWLAPNLTATAYVPTVAERNGDFSAFGGLLVDPENGLPFPAGLIPPGRVPAVFAWRVTTASFVNQQRAVELKLVSDVPGLAFRTDPNLVNPWGISFSATSPFWISDNHAGVSTLYNSFGGKVPLVVNTPLPPGATGLASPTGQVFNGTPDFVVTSGGKSGPARFIFATEEGTVSGWNPSVNRTNAILAFDNSASGAVYKGLAMGSDAQGNNFLFATNFNSGAVDVLDASFNWVNSFTDPAIPAGFAPFGIQNINGNLYVTFAMQDADKHDDVGGPGNGFVDVFDTSGNVKRLTSHGTLNSPWGLALVTSPFWGALNGALLVGNFGDGRISAFDPNTSALLGQLQDRQNNPLEIDGLWALTFGNGHAGGIRNWLYFTAGPEHEAHGLFGALIPLRQTSP